MAEDVHHPSHYNEGKFEAIDVIEDWELSFNTGNAVKYISRHKHKDRPQQDLEKAFWYLTRELISIYGANKDRLSQIVLTIQNDTLPTQRPKN